MLTRNENRPGYGFQLDECHNFNLGVSERKQYDSQTFNYNQL